MGSLPIGRVEKGPAGGRLLVLSLRKDLRFTRVTINSKGPVAVDRLNWIEAVLACFELGKKQNSSESVRRVLTSPSTGRRTIEGPKEGKGQTRLAFKHLSFPLTGRKVVTSVSVSAVQKRTRAKRTRGR